MSELAEKNRERGPGRALCIGVLMAVVINTVFPYGLLVMGTLDWTGDFIALSAIFLLFVLVIINIPLKWIKREWGLSVYELVLIYAMMAVASAIPSTGVTAQLVPFLAGIFYYATPENNWIEILHPHIQPWLAPQDPTAVKYFYEGLPKDMAIPWGVWLIPLLSWASFLIALYLMMIALSSLLHEQWARNERLVFPLMQLPLDMIREDEKSSRVNPFLKDPLMWLGFMIPFVLLGINGLHKYFPFVPAVELSTQVTLFHDMRGILFSLWFIVLGLTYFLSLEVSFSLWFFYLLNFFQLGFFNILGFSIPEIRLMHTEGSIATAQQAMGAMIALVAVSLWTARGHLKEAFASAFKKTAQQDAAGQLLSSRKSVWLLLTASSYAVLWLNHAGLPLGASLLLLFIAFVVFVGLTRIVAEGGMGYGRAQMTPAAFTINALGTAPIGPQGLLVLGFSNGWAGDIRTTVMAAAANSTRLAEVFKIRRAPLFWAMVLALSVSLVASAWTVISIAYTYGGVNLHYWFYGYMSRWSFNDIVANQLNPVESWNFWGPRGFFTGIGAGLMLVLMYLRHRFLWWPIHPIGLPVGGTYVMFFAWSSMALGWLVKWTVLKYGGAKLFVRLRPFFLGMVLGQVSSAGVWMVVDLVLRLDEVVTRW